MRPVKYFKDSLVKNLHVLIHSNYCLKLKIAEYKSVNAEQNVDCRVKVLALLHFISRSSKRAERQVQPRQLSSFQTR